MPFDSSSGGGPTRLGDFNTVMRTLHVVRDIRCPFEYFAIRLVTVTFPFQACSSTSFWFRSNHSDSAIHTRVNTNQSTSLTPA